MRFALLLCVMLMACDTPTREFAAAPVMTLAVGPSTFDIRRIGDRAQAIRTNTEWAPNWKYTALRFAGAIEQATGCQIKKGSLQGDQALMEARLTCPFDTRENIAAQTINLDCYEGPSTRPGFDCEVVRPVATPNGP